MSEVDMEQIYAYGLCGGCYLNVPTSDFTVVPWE